MILNNIHSSVYISYNNNPIYNWNNIRYIIFVILNNNYQSLSQKNNFIIEYSESRQVFKDILESGRNNLQH